MRDLGAALRFEALRLRPQAIRPAFRDAARAARALIGGGLRDRDDIQARKTGVGVVTRFARQAAVDHDAHAGQRDAGFGDVGGQHDAATIARRQHARLLIDGQLAVQREHLDVAQGFASRDRRIDLRDLALAGQEHEDIAGMLRDGLFDRAARLRHERFVAARGEMRDVDGVRASRARQSRRIEETREPFAIERRRHHHDAQVLAQSGLHVERECEAEIAGEVAFVEFVEQQCADAFEHRIVLQHAREDAFGDDFDARARRHLALEADAVADRLARRFAQLFRHEAGGGARGHAARFEHQDLAAGEPRRIEQASGTCVVLPAPGGASSTSRGCAARLARSSGNSGAMGKSAARTREVYGAGPVNCGPCSSTSAPTSPTTASTTTATPCCNAHATPAWAA